MAKKFGEFIVATTKELKINKEFVEDMWCVLKTDGTILGAYADYELAETLAQGYDRSARKLLESQMEKLLSGQTDETD